MSSQGETRNMAVFCDFENIALGVREAKYDKFDMKKVLERLLVKGSIVVKKAYCDWDRYKEFKAPMHEAAFEMIEIPHVRQSGKNSADIRMVVDALDLCYTKAHVDTFVIISGDSDFSPLVSKLRENNKEVIGVGVKHSTSDLLIANCDEFMFYDDLVREKSQARRGGGGRKKPAAKPAAAPKTPAAGPVEAEEAASDDKTQKAIDLVVNTFEALVSERGGDDKIWGSMVKQALKRRNPGFNEAYHGFKSFNSLLEEAAIRGHLNLEHDEKSGGYIVRAPSVEPNEAAA
ncbi:MAG: NYN domain-containing protein [Pseudomonadota bacterium]